MGELSGDRVYDIRTASDASAVDAETLRCARQDMIEVGRRIWVKGFVAANDGNLSIRLAEDRYLTTATGSIKGFLAESDLVLIDGRAEPVTGAASGRRPSSEIRMHLAIYQARPDVKAVVHAHPPTATGFATAGVELDTCVLPEIVATLGAVPTVPYGTPSTRELSDAVRAHAGEGHACLLANHGAVTYADGLFTAYHHMERVEHYAKILLTARQLGNVQRMTADQVDRLRAATGAPPRRCRVCGEETASGEVHTCLPDAVPRPSGAIGGGEAAVVERIARALRRVLEEGEEISDGPGTHG